MYSKGKTFKDVNTAYCRVFGTRNEICRYNMTDFQNCEALIVAQIYLSHSRWKVQALGIPASGRTFKESYDQIQSVARSKKSAIYTAGPLSMAGGIKAKVSKISKKVRGFCSRIWNVSDIILIAHVALGVGLCLFIKEIIFKIFF
eukprot:GHVP01056271.1.p1 GENE.GHVP01056271.1~~GHVP01056271.1.p1  ORF type:complete len:145 (+),score=12.08 GHVP01056271.1:465-899(+)